ncbi:MAG TPA: hypothetical protein VNX65_01065 [Patescibacteria group bacterium]|jgi:hypothetical protein|nr:hypothetical protein [Patescibacteria group bacterium]
MQNDAFPVFRPEIRNPNDNITAEVARHQITMPVGMRENNTVVGVVTSIGFEPQPSADDKMVLSMIEGSTLMHRDLLKAAGLSERPSDNIIHIRFGDLEEDILIRLVRMEPRKTTSFIIGYGSPDPTNPDFKLLNDLITEALYKEYKGDSTSVRFEYYNPGAPGEKILPGDLKP